MVMRKKMKYRNPFVVWVLTAAMIFGFIVFGQPAKAADAPSAAVNIALGKTAVASSVQDDSHTPAKGVDADNNTLWIASNGDAGNWWEVDLGQEYLLTGSEITFETAGAVWKYQIQVSTDEQAWTTVADESGNTETAQTQTQSFSADARYIRVLFGSAPGDCWTAFAEFAAFGNPAMDFPDIVNGKPASTSSTQDEDHAPAMGADDNDGTMWIASDGNAGNWWEVDLQQEYALTGSRITFETAGPVWQYQIEVSSDEREWTTVADESANTSTAQIQQQNFTADGRYIRIVFGAAPEGCWTAFREFELSGSSKDLPETPSEVTATADGQNRITVSWSPSEGATAYDLNVDGKKVSDVTSPYAVTGLRANSRHLFEVAAKNGNGESAFSDPTAATTQIAAGASGKRIMVLVAHEDDEAIIASGVIEDALSEGFPVKVVIATNGDYNATGTGVGRMRLQESINAMQVLGLSKSNIIALGYGDTGGEPDWSPMTDSFLYKLYTAGSGTQIISSSVGTKTYGIPGVLDDYHEQLTGTHGDYNRNTFEYDLTAAINSFRPTDIYTTSLYDLHGDHQYINRFARDVIQSIRRGDSGFSPVLHEAIIHGAVSDSGWPVIAQDPDPIEPETIPDVLSQSPLDWNAREILPVPPDMLVTPRALNRKYLALEQYVSQFNVGIGSYAQSDEDFWTTDF